MLALKGISKTFGELRANHAVDFEIAAGEIHALLGENGAGKSTLAKIACGTLQADAGSIAWRGEPVELASPTAARALGIGAVFQHFSLFRALTVLENIALGLPGMQLEELRAKIQATVERYGLALDPARPLHTLSVGEWQRVEIVRCLLGDPKLLLLDEPTSVLTPQEAERLFVVLRRLAEEGRAILYISHRLAEIRQLCARATVMRAGEVVARCDPAAETPASLGEMMIGRRPAAPQRPARQAAAEHSLELRGLNLPKHGLYGQELKDIKLKVQAGKIVGIAGVAGNGQAELGAVLAGEVPVADASLLLDGQPAGQLSQAARRKLGLRFVPEERHGHGAVSELPLWENACLTALDEPTVVARGMLRKARAQDLAAQVIERFDVRAEGVQAPAASLSGGNLQKFIVGRELLRAPRQLVVMQPTWGVDVGAAMMIHQALLDMAAQGAAVLLVSQDLDELLLVADEIAVLEGGVLGAPAPASELTAAALGLQMGAAPGPEDALAA